MASVLLDVANNSVDSFFVPCSLGRSAAYVIWELLTIVYNVNGGEIHEFSNETSAHDRSSVVISVTKLTRFVIPSDCWVAGFCDLRVHNSSIFTILPVTIPVYNWQNPSQCHIWTSHSRGWGFQASRTLRCVAYLFPTFRPNVLPLFSKSNSRRRVILGLNIYTASHTRRMLTSKPLSFLGAFAKLRKATFSYITSLRPSFRPLAWKNSAPTGRNFIKYDTWVFLQNLSRIFNFS
jgi:hypothetical protein